VPFVHGIGKTRQPSSANHNRLAIIVYNVSYSALSSPMNILSTYGGFWVNEVSRAGYSGGLESYTLATHRLKYLCIFCALKIMPIYWLMRV